MRTRSHALRLANLDEDCLLQIGSHLDLLDFTRLRACSRLFRALKRGEGDRGRQLVSHAEVAAIHDAHYARLASAEGQRLLAQLRAGAQDQARDFRADRRAEKRDQ